MMRPPRLLLILGLLTVLSSTSCAPLPRTPLPRESAGRWTEWPNTSLREAALVPEPMPNGGGESGTASSIINAWTSGSYEPGANRLLLVRHGGHADTAHNGVLALALTTPPRWQLLKDTSYGYAPINSQNPGPYGPTYPDGTPASLHTYDCEEWLPGVSAVYSGGGIYWSPGGNSTPQEVYWFTPSTNAYTKKAVRPGGYGCASIWDPVTSRLLLRFSGNLYSYDPATDAYTNLLTKGNANMAYGSVLYLDAAGRKVYRFEKGGSLWVIDLAANPVTEVALASEGDTDILQVAGAGGAFVDGKIVTYGRNADKTRGALYTVPVGTCGLTGQPKCQWTRHDPADGVSPPLPTTQGMWKKAWISGGRFWVVTQSGDNVWSYLLSGSAPVTYPLTVTKSGNGQGTVTGAGSYAAGAAVTITATPAAGSVAGTLTPAPCAPQFPMPAQALECVQAFTASAPPPTTYPLTLATSGTGQGTVAGAGSYAAGATVTLTATPAAGSSSGGWSPAPCAPSFPMPANALSCTHTFTASAPPPSTKPEASVSGPDAQGRYTVTITQPDGKGNVATTAVQTAITASAPPQPPQEYQLSITTSGTGTGTTSGAGSYPAGTVVVLVATPASDSTFAGWSGDADCTDGSVTMTAARACVATFTKKPTPPTGGARTWIPFDPRMVDPRDGTTKTAWFLGSKHTRLLYDSARGRMVLAGGDYTVPENDYGSGSGQYVWELDVASSDKVWRNLHGWCAPSGSPMPARPDNVTWVYDSKRARGVVMPAYFFGTANCPGVTDTKDGYTFDFAARRWALATWPKPVASGGYGGDSQDHWGVYDPTSDSVYRVYNHGGSMKMQVIPLDGRPDELISLSPYGCPSGVTCDMTNDMSAIDVQGRAVYVICRPCRKLLKYSIPDKRVVEQIPMPAAWTAPTSEYGGLDYETLLTFDSRHRVLMNPNTMSYGGTISGSGLSFYNVDTKVWESEAAPAEVSGNVLAYDAGNDYFVFLGRSTTSKFWLYRYAPPADRGGDGHVIGGRVQRGPRRD